MKRANGKHRRYPTLTSHRALPAGRTMTKLRYLGWEGYAAGTFAADLRRDTGLEIEGVNHLSVKFHAGWCRRLRKSGTSYTTPVRLSSAQWIVSHLRMRGERSPMAEIMSRGLVTLRRIIASQCRRVESLRTQTGEFIETCRGASLA